MASQGDVGEGAGALQADRARAQPDAQRLVEADDARTGSRSQTTLPPSRIFRRLSARKGAPPPGLADVLTGSMPWESATRSLSDILLGDMPMDIVMLTPGMDNLHILPSGSNPLNPAELLSSQAMAECTYGSLGPRCMPKVKSAIASL